MRLRNLVQVLMFEATKENVLGEYETKWIFRGSAYLNKQQNLNELDRNSAGEIDFENIKLYTDSAKKLKKGYGVSFIAGDGLKYQEEILKYQGETVLIEGMESLVPPDYIVDSCVKVGKSIVFTCKLNSGE